MDRPMDGSRRTQGPLPSNACDRVSAFTAPRARHSRHVRLDQFGHEPIASERLFDLGRVVTELATLQLVSEGSARASASDQDPTETDRSDDEEVIHPGQCLAAGSAANFLGALLLAASKGGSQVPPDTSVDASVDIGTGPVGEATVRLLLHVALPGLTAWAAQGLLAHAHDLCPYAHISRDAVDVLLRAA